MAKKFNMTLKAKERRQRTIKRLEDQLKAGKKTLNIIKEGRAYDPLSKEDITRIDKELKTLKERI